ncbi:MAG: hypothetical protein H0W59_02275 [Chloroflexia bacterium]|jgi:hypothetical protein|nr:hypothetical protein [Chloroflexia bacterium]
MVDYYFVGPQPIGVQVIALETFGDDNDSRIGADLRVDGWVRVRILMPESPSIPGSDTQEKYRAAVRELARTYKFHHTGPVDIVFNPSSDGRARQYEPPGEQVNRPS